jgi:hypothetical protein
MASKRNALKTQIENYINGDIKMDEIDAMKEILEEQIILLNLLLMVNKNEMR